MSWQAASWAALGGIAVILLLWWVEVGSARMHMRQAMRQTDLDHQGAHDVRDLRCMRLIHSLREREGWSVELIGDNPDWGTGPNAIVDVFGEWPAGQCLMEFPPNPGAVRFAKEEPGRIIWGTRRFEGQSLLHALQVAAEAVRRAGV